MPCKYVAIPHGGLRTPSAFFSGKLGWVLVVTIPHGGLRTANSGKSGKRKEKLSPSHTVGLEHGNEVGKMVEVLIKSPSHTVGLEHEKWEEELIWETLSPSHAVGLEPIDDLVFSSDLPASPSHTVGLEQGRA